MRRREGRRDVEEMIGREGVKGNGTREKGRSEEGREKKKVRVKVVRALQTMCVPFFNILFHLHPPVPVQHPSLSHTHIHTLL